MFTLWGERRRPDDGKSREPMQTLREKRAVLYDELPGMEEMVFSAVEKGDRNHTKRGKAT